MARFARVVVENVPYHVTQRGNAGQFLPASDAERLVWLDLSRGLEQTRHRRLASQKGGSP